MNSRSGCGRSCRQSVVVRRVVGVRREAHRDLELDRVGVLELVEEDPLVRARAAGADVRSGGQQPPGRTPRGRGTRVCRRTRGRRLRRARTFRRALPAATGGTPRRPGSAGRPRQRGRRSASRSASSCVRPAVRLPLGLVAALPRLVATPGDPHHRVEAGADRVAGRSTGRDQRSRRAPRVGCRPPVLRVCRAVRPRHGSARCQP